MGMPTHLSPGEIEEFGREMDAIRNEVMDSRGDKDREYILRVIKWQRLMALGGRIVIFLSLIFSPWGGLNIASWPLFVAVLGLGATLLGLAKIIENMELGHNVVHHSWTNVFGKDPDIGYGVLRVSADQKWRPKYLANPIVNFILMMLFQWGVALHDLEADKIIEGKKNIKEAVPMLRRIGWKVVRQVRKDYLLWPAFGAVLTMPVTLVLGLEVFAIAGYAFVTVAIGNLIANGMRNIWSNVIIFCGHFPEGVHLFTKEEVEGETRAAWYVRQLLGSCNIGGGKIFHILSGNLSHQIEHHLFPDVPSNRYPEMSPRVQALAARYKLPYNTGSFSRQFGTTTMKIWKLSFPN